MENGEYKALSAEVKKIRDSLDDHTDRLARIETHLEISNGRLCTLEERERISFRYWSMLIGIAAFILFLGPGLFRFGAFILSKLIQTLGG